MLKGLPSAALHRTGPKGPRFIIGYALYFRVSFICGFSYSQNSFPTLFTIAY